MKKHIIIGSFLMALCSCTQAAQHPNVVFFLVDDLGWHLGEKEHWRKHALWEVSTRPPLVFSAPVKLARNPEGVAKDKLCHRPVSLIDIYPTLFDLCGLPKRKGLDGQSLKPLLQNPSKQWERPVLITYGLNNHALRTQRWRHVLYRDGGEELYDHDHDPHEWTNLASSPKYSSVRIELAKWLPVTNLETKQ